MRYYKHFFQVIKIIVFVFLIFFNHHSSVSQDKKMIFEHLTIEDGLSQSTVNCIMQDSKGFMWFGTSAGLNKYDGSFKIYKNEHENLNSLCSNSILCLYEDTQGNIWIGSSEGLNKLDIEYGKFYSYRHDPENINSLCNNIVMSIYQDNTGILWIGTDGGIDKLDTKNNKFTHLSSALQDSKNTNVGSINSIYQDSYGDIWIGTVYGGLLKYLPDKFYSLFAHNLQIYSLVPNLLDYYYYRHFCHFS